jgi:hypothetical protein
MLQVRRNDRPQLEAVGGRLDQPVQYDRRWLVRRQSVTDFTGSSRRRDFDDPIGRELGNRLGQRPWLAMTTARQLIGANPRSVLAGKDAQDLPFDRGRHVAFDESQHRWIKLI